MTRLLRISLGVALPLAAALPAPAQDMQVSGPGLSTPPRRLAAAQLGAQGFQVLGRGPVSWTRTTGLVVFRGMDGRDYAMTGTAADCQGCARGRVYVWDVTTPDRPTLTDSVQVDATVISDIAVNARGNRAVLTRQGAESRRNGMVFLDLSEPAHPRVSGEYWESILGGVHHPVWEGSMVFAVDAGSNDMVAVDASNPNDPREASRWGIPYSPDKDLQHVAVDSGLAYLAYGDDGLIVLDIGRGIREGTLRRPRMVAQFRYRTEWRGQRWGNTHWAVPHTTSTGEKLLFVADEIIPYGSNLSRRSETAGYLHVLDVSNPAAPRELAYYAYPGSGIRALYAHGDTLLVAAHGAGVRAVDVRAPLRGAIRDREIGFFAMGEEPSLVQGVPYAWDVTMHNGLVYATDANSGLWIARPVERTP